MNANQRARALFLHACDAPDPLEVEITYPGRYRPVRRAFHQPFMLIGRDVRNDLRVDDPDVNPCHAYLQVVAGGIYCVDLRRQEVSPRARWLSKGRGMRIGDYVIRPPMHGSRDDGLASRPACIGDPMELGSAGEAGCPRTVLELLNSKTRREPRPLTRVLTLVGQSPDCGLRLLGASVSDFHCALLATPWGTWIIDLLGEGGVFVNERRVSWARLEYGDRLLVGKFYYRLHYEEPPKSLPESAAQATETAHTDLAPDSSPSCRAGSPPLGPAEIPPSLRVSFVGSFGYLQQVIMDQLSQATQQHRFMFDQFQQSLTKLLDVFEKAHQGDTTLFREELFRLQALTDEMALLRNALALGCSNPTTDRGWQPSDSRPAEPVLVDAGEPASAAYFSSTRGGRASAADAVHPDEWATPDQRQSYSEALSEVDGYEWLQHRIEALQGERQSIWQKVLGRVLGSAT